MDISAAKIPIIFIAHVGSLTTQLNFIKIGGTRYR